MESTIFVIVIIGCLVCIAIYILRHKPELLVNFCLRASLGVLAIYAVDSVLKGQGMGVSVGINGATLLTSGLLGLPGCLMLYGLAFYYGGQ